jgi:very-short-patch-repair endonuclease
LRIWKRTLSSLARRGKPGVQRLRKVLEARSPSLEISKSVLERKLVRLLMDASLPQPVQQFPLPWRAQQSGRVDLAYPAARILIEADRRRWHSLSEAFETDRRRDNLAMLAGWRVLRFTWQDITDRSGQVVAMIREALATNPPALAESEAPPGNFVQN